MLLYDELIKRLIQTELNLGQKNYEVFEGAIGRSVNITHYLDDTLDRQLPIGANPSRLYGYFCYELSRVVSGRSAKELARVKEMAPELRDSFWQAEKSAATSS